MPTYWDWVQKGTPFDIGIIRRRDELYPQVLPSGTRAGGTHSGHPKAQPPQRAHQQQRALEPPGDSEILNLTSREWIPCTCLCTVNCLSTEFYPLFTCRTGPSPGRRGGQLQFSYIPQDLNISHPKGEPHTHPPQMCP